MSALLDWDDVAELRGAAEMFESMAAAAPMKHPTRGAVVAEAAEIMREQAKVLRRVADKIATSLFAEGQS